MVNIILTAIISLFFCIGVYSTVREIWHLLTDDYEDDEDDEPH